MRTTSAAFSLAAHVALISAAVYATGASAPRAAPPPVRHVLLPAPPVPRGPRPPVIPDLVLPNVGGQLVPPLELPSLPPLGVAAPRPGGDAPVGANPAMAIRGTGGADVVSATLMEDPPVLLSAPVPAYPELLRQSGMVGRVVLQAVVDTAGRVERGSIRVASATHWAFVAAATQVLGGALFRPGRMSGRAVRVLVELPIEFRLRGGRLGG